jgi:hypothetical protein
LSALASLSDPAFINARHTSTFRLLVGSCVHQRSARACLSLEGCQMQRRALFVTRGVFLLPY